MAVTKLLRIKASSKGAPSSGLKRCLDYICNLEKTDGGRLIDGLAGGDPDFVYHQMLFNKQFWNQPDGTQGFHYVISFSPEEDVTEELALQVGKEFCQELLKDQFLYVCASHTDREHKHVHCVFCPVNLYSGRKFISPKNDWKNRIQPIVDGICQRHGLSMLSYDDSKERKSMYHREWEELHTNEGEKPPVSWNSIIRDDLDECIGQASSWEEFLCLLTERHYEYHDGKYLSLKPYGKEKAIRSIRLGEEYSKEALQKRIGKHTETLRTEGRDYPLYGDPLPVCRSAFRYYQRSRHYSLSQKCAWIRFIRLSHIRRPESKASAWKYKKDAARLGRTTDMVAYLFDHDITSKNDAEKRLEELSRSRGTEAARERKLCRRILSELEPSAASAAILFEPSAYKSSLPTSETIRQVYINKTLFLNADLTKETYSVRIPGTREYVRLYSADSRSYNDGSLLSSYIFPEADYCVVDNENSVLRYITGEALAGYFKTKEITRKEGSSAWKRK